MTTLAGSDEQDEQTPVAAAGRRRGPHRLTDLARPTRLLLLAVAIAVSLAPVLGAALVLNDGWVPVGDRAIIGLRAADVWTGDRPELGQPTTGEHYTGEPSNHPGPSEYWILAPFTKVLGTQAGLAVGTACVSATALAASLWAAFRGGGRVLFSLTALGLALYLRSLGLAHFADPMNSEVVAVLLLPTALAAWLVMLGDLRGLPMLAVTATVAGQAHVTGAANVVPIAVVATGAAAWHLRDRSRWHGARGPVLATLAIVAVLWAPPIAYELGSDPSNLAALRRAGTSDAPVVGYRYAADRVVTAVAPLPLFVLGPEAEAHRQHRSTVAVLAAGLLLGALGSAAVLHGWRRWRSPVVALLAVTGVTVAVGAFSAARILREQVSRGDGFRSLWTMGLLCWIALAWAAWSALPPGRRRRAIVAVERGLGALTALVLVVALTAGVGRDPDRDGDHMPVAVEAGDAVAEGVPDGRYRIHVEGTEALVTFAPAIIGRLEAAGSTAFVDFGPQFGRPYGTHRQYQGQDVDGTIIVRSDGEGRLRPDGPGAVVADVSRGSLRLIVALESA